MRASDSTAGCALPGDALERAQQDCAPTDQPTHLYFSHAHFPVTTLGFGRRVGVWLQGCSIGCPGCVAPQTWHRTPAHRVSVDALLERLGAYLAAADGVTISGGEPFEQPAALRALIAGVRRACAGDILVYSGRAEARLRAEHSDILATIDVLIPEPFVDRAPSSHPLTGSANQPVRLLTELARRRYRDFGDGGARMMNLAPAADRVRLAGILRRGEMARLAAVAR